MLEYRYDTQLLIEGEGLDEDEITEYFNEHFDGDCLLAVGDDDLITIHFHTNRAGVPPVLSSAAAQIAQYCLLLPGC